MLYYHLVHNLFLPGSCVQIHAISFAQHENITITSWTCILAQQISLLLGIHIKDFLAIKHEWHITYIFWNYKRDSLRIVCKTISNYKHSYQLLNDTYKWSTGTQTIERNKANLVFEEIQKFWGRNNLINCLLTIDFHKVVKTVYSSIWYWMYFIWLNVE